MQVRRLHRALLNEERMKKTITALLLAALFAMGCGSTDKVSKTGVVVNKRYTPATSSMHYEPSMEMWVDDSTPESWSIRVCDGDKDPAWVKVDQKAFDALKVGQLYGGK
jgi:hypothetical protein